MRTLLLLLLTLTLLFGWQRLVWTVTPAAGVYPIAGARFAQGVAGAFPSRACYCAADGLPSKLLLDLQFAPAALANPKHPQVWLLGSGLRHHYVLAALTRVNQVISFDAHTDMRSGDEIDCGNWLRHWLTASPDRRAMVIGVSEMLGGETWLSRTTEFQPLLLLAAGRVQLWPVHARRSFFHEPLPVPAGNPSVAAAGGDKHESYLQWKSIDELQLPRGQKLAVTVDLDCLAERGFAGEWQTGELRLPRLLAMLGDLARWNTVESVSICGFAAKQSDLEREALVAVLRAIVSATENR